MRLGRWAGAAVATAILIALGGCSQARQALGLNKQAPDEFQVVARAPLSLPPDYSLRPPEPGAPRPQEGTARDQAETVLFGGYQNGLTGAGPEGSQGEAALLQSAGATGIDPNIRRLVNQETNTLIAEDKRFIDTLVFWRDPEPYQGEIVDPVAEQQRLQENAALGKPVTEGDTPIIERKERGILEGIF